jgi:RNA polymerase-binding transcription factor DksA
MPLNAARFSYYGAATFCSFGKKSREIIPQMPKGHGVVLAPSERRALRSMAPFLPLTGVSFQLAHSGVTMNGIVTVSHSARLRRRRHDIDVTLRYLERERRQVIANASFMDPQAYDSRLRLLDQIARSYQREIADIDKTTRGLRRTSGRCAACQEPIEADRLESEPDADLCWDCSESSEALRG